MAIIQGELNVNNKTKILKLFKMLRFHLNERHKKLSLLCVYYEVIIYKRKNGR